MSAGLDDERQRLSDELASVKQAHAKLLQERNAAKAELMQTRSKYSTLLADAQSAPPPTESDCPQPSALSVESVDGAEC